jgi:flavodoxin
MKNRMKSFIIYDSIYGNTEKIAQAIGDGLTGEVKVVRVGEVNPSELKTFDLLIIGSPVLLFRLLFRSALSKYDLKGLR